MKRGRTAASRTANVADAAEFTCTVKLTSKQADLFDVEKVVACRSVTVSNAVEDTGFDNPVPLPTVDSKILMKAWDMEFVKVDDETLFNLILAANYMEIKSLLDLTCKTVADAMKGKTPDEIRTRFNITNDFTPEEEDEIIRANVWCEEH